MATREELIINTPENYTGLTGVEVKTGMEAVSVDAAAKTVTFAPEIGEYYRLTSADTEQIYNLMLAPDQQAEMSAAVQFSTKETEKSAENTPG